MQEKRKPQGAYFLPVRRKGVASRTDKEFHRLRRRARVRQIVPSRIMASHRSSGALSPVFGMLVGAGVAGGVCVGTGVGVGVGVRAGVGVGVGVRVGVGEGVGGADLFLVKALMRKFPFVFFGLYISSHF